MRAWLRDDNRCIGDGAVDGYQVGLDDDWDCRTGGPFVDSPEALTPAPPVTDADAGSPYWQCEVLGRIRSGFDDDGVPLFEWRSMVTSAAILRVDRTERDPVAGITSEVGTVTLAYDGDVRVFETAVVRRSDGVVYRITGVDESSTVLRLKVARLDQQPDGTL